jgi:dienelactone hydrolase
MLGAVTADLPTVTKEPNMHITRNLMISSLAVVTLATATYANTAASATTTSTPKRAETILAAPDGPSAVGVVDLPMPNAVAYYPAKPNTGTGLHPYLAPLDPKMLSSMGIPAPFSALTTTSRVAAQPEVAKSPRPVVVLAPGFGSVIALCTSLAEHLASHGYVVVAVQTDLLAETAAMMPNDAQGVVRRKQIDAALSLIESTAFAKLVGPVDRTRIAVGGHSYAGSVAFNMSLHDARVSAVFDLDGLLFDEAAKVPTKVPSLVITSAGGTSDNAVLRKIVGSGTNIVAVGLVGARHSDLTDAAAIGPMLRKAGLPTDLGSIGPVATSNTSTIVRRFLDATMTNPRHLPTTASLIKGLPSTTATAFVGGS